MTDLVGRRLGDFEVARELGRGGMGVVYEARQVSLNRRVALKVLTPGLGLTPKAVSRFRREAEAAAGLHHTNIVPVYATGEEAGLHFYAMELIDGPSLDRVVTQLREQRGGAAKPTPTLAPQLTTTGPYLDTSTPTGSGVSSGLSTANNYFDAVARMTADVADALHHAHQNNVVHRDIKPSNLLLSPDGRLSVNDFGLARVLEEPGMTTTGEFLGTPAYMAPEQIAGGRIPIDHRCDVYSLGATLYELLTLRPPFVADRRDQLLAMVVQKEPAAPHSLNPKVPRDLETICLKCLEKDPDRRYTNAKKLAEDLRRYVNRFAIVARRAGPFTKLKKWVKRNPALSAALAAAVACAAVAGGLAYRGHLEERKRVEDQARHEAELLDEKRRSALDKAILAARLEDFNGARQAIREAELLGCSAGQIRMLQGQLELYQGHAKEALEHLTQAVTLLPESVAARSMLARAFAESDQMTDFNRVLVEALRLPAVSPEDYLFRGHAESALDPERGLQSLDEAMRRRPSTLARMIRTDARRMQVLIAPNLDQAILVLQDVRALRRELPDNEMVLGLSVQVHLSCYYVFDELRKADLRDAARDEGVKDVVALERYPDSAQAVVTRWLFLDGIGKPELGIDSLRRLWETTKSPKASYSYGLACYRRGEFAKANEVLEQVKDETHLHLLRIVALAELRPDGVARANKLYQEIAARDLDIWNLFNSQLMLRLLGRQAEAVAVSRKFLTLPERFPPVRQDQFRRALEYCAGQCSADDLIAFMRGNRGDLVNAHLCIALTALADGNRAEARKHLQQCVDTHYFEFLPYDFARMFLSRMDADPNWPRWIPVK